MSEHDIHNEACGCSPMPAPVTIKVPGGTLRRVTAAEQIAALRAEVELRTKERDQQERFKWKANERADAAFLRGASWAYCNLTGAIIVPASFEEKARAERDEK